jgi:transcriptional regulator with XRE-family HTH domain
MAGKRIVRRLETSYLESLRLERGLSADEVCRRAQIDPITLRRLEVCGVQRPHAATVQKLADLYDIRPAKLADELFAYRRRYVAAEREAETAESAAA